MKKTSFGVLVSRFILIFCALLAVKSASASTGDGIPDSWRVQFFGSVSDPRALATADPDGDGASNYQEYLGGTNPLDSTSVPLMPISLETYAGSVAGSRDGMIAEATFTSPCCIRRDPQGRFWILEATWQAWTTPLVGAHRIRILDPVAGTVSTFAGSAEPGYVDGPAATARFNTPTDLVFDSHGNAFIAEHLGHRIRKIDRNNVVTTFAGSQMGNHDGRGTNAMFHTPNTLAIDGQDNLYVADFDNYSIRKITPAGDVTTLTGNGAGDWDGSLATAQFNTPACLAIKADGTLFVSDWVNGKVREISTAGQVSTFAAGLTYVEWVTLDAANHVYASLPDGPVLKQFDMRGQALWSLNVPYGFKDGPISQAKAGRFNALELLPDGNFLFPDGDANRIRHMTMGLPPVLTMTPAGGLFTNYTQISLSTIAANGVIYYTLDGSEPTSVSAQYVGLLAITNSATLKARVFVNNIPVTSIATAVYTLSGSVNPADGIAADWRVKYFGSVTDSRAAATADPDGDGANNYQEYLAGTNPLDASSTPWMPVSMETYAGSVAGDKDGVLAQATFKALSSCQRDAQGQLWVTEASWAAWTTPLVGSHRVRVIDTQGNVKTLAGSDEPGYVDGPAAAARFNTPIGVVFDRQGNAFVTERLGNRIRKIDRAGMVSTFAGSQLGNFDGKGTHAMFHTPIATVIDGNDNLFVADFDNYSIRKITPDGMVSTLIGNGRGDMDGDLHAAQFNSPDCLALKPDGTLIVSDYVNGRIRQISPAGQVTTLVSGLGFIEWVGLDAKGHLYAATPQGPMVNQGPTLNQYDLNDNLNWSLGLDVGFQDGPIAQAKIARLNGLQFLSDGAYIPDAANNRIRHLTMGAPALVTLAPAGGLFTNVTQVSLATIVNNGVVRYTLDGTEPTMASAAYAAPLTLSASTTIRARVFVNGIPVSSVVSGIFTQTSGSSGALATRQLPANYLPGKKITVSIAVNPPTSTTAYAVEDQLPAGWQIGATMSDGGQYDTKNKVVKFGPYIDNTPRTLSYEVLPAASGVVAVFSGYISIDGTENLIGGDSEISPILLHPADIQPADSRITIGELTAYGAAWKRGDLWSIAPNPIPVSYVTRAAYLWRNGEVYRYDPSMDVQAPLSWVSDTNSIGKANFQGVVTSVVSELELEFSDTLDFIAEPANEATATMPPTYAPGRPLAVEIALQPLATTLVNAIEETMPEGWIPVEISDAGSFDSIQRKIKWGPFFDASPRILRYQAIPTQGGMQTVSFSGLASFDGENVAVAGIRQVAPAPLAAPALEIQTDSLGNRSLTLTLAEPLGSVVRIEYSKDLKSWQTALTFTNTTGTAVISDSALLVASAVFFRVVPAE